MRFIQSLAILFCVAGSVCGQSVTLPAEVKGASGAWIIISPESIDGGAPKWRIDPGLQEVRLDLLLPPELLTKLKGKVVTGTKGRYKVESWNAKGDKASDIATCWVVIDGGGPPPPPPPDPIDPPTPKPTAGTRVLIVYESANLQKMPPMQQAILFSQSVRAYLDSKCVVGPNGKTREWRIWDKDVDTSKESAFWQASMKNVPSVPYLRILDNSGGIAFQGELPGDVSAAMALLKKHLGE